jgi:hypothetical protein
MFSKITKTASGGRLQMKKNEITRDELKRIYKADKPLHNKGKSKNNSGLTEAELLPYVKLLYAIYKTDNLTIQS